MKVGTGHESWMSHGVAWINQLGKPSVLIFLFLSGFAFGSKREKPALRRFYLSRALRILPLYILVSAVGIYQLPGQPWEKLPLALLDGSAMFHLYFVALLFYLYLLYPLLRRVPFTPLTLTLYGLVLLSPDLYHLTVQGLFPLEQGSPLPVKLSLKAIYVAYALPFFQAGLWIGDFLARQKESEQKAALQERRGIALRWLYLSFAYLLVLFHFYHQVAGGTDPDTSGRIWRLSVVLYAAGWISVVLALPARHSPLLSSLARAGYMVYLLHPFGIQLTRGYLSWNPWLHTAAVALLTWSTALVLHELAKRSVVLGLFLGEGDRLLKLRFASPAPSSLLQGNRT